MEVALADNEIQVSVSLVNRAETGCFDYLLERSFGMTSGLPTIRDIGLHNGVFLDTNP